MHFKTPHCVQRDLIEHSLAACSKLFAHWPLQKKKEKEKEKYIEQQCALPRDTPNSHKAIKIKATAARAHSPEFDSSPQESWRLGDHGLSLF